MTEWLCVDVDGYEIVNVYKPLRIRLQVSDLPVFTNSCFYAGDFNCQHVDWGYDANSADGECLVGWASTNNLSLFYNSKDAANFHSDRWNTSNNPDLAFVSIDSDSRLPDRRVGEKFARSQHRPSLITPPRFARPVPSKPVERWNFCKAKCSQYITFTNKFERTLPPPDSPDMDHAYQCVTILISGIFMLLSCVNIVFLFWSLFPVFPRIQTVACVFYSQSNFIGSYFPYSPSRPTAFLLVVLWVAVSGIPPSSNPLLLIFSC